MNTGAGSGRLNPNPGSHNNIGRFVSNPGPTGVYFDEQDNKYFSYQDPITGKDNAYYTDSDGARVYSEGGQNYVWKSEPYNGDKWVRITVDGKTRFRRDFGVLGYRYYFTFASNNGGQNWTTTAIDHTSKTVFGTGLMTKGREIAEVEYVPTGTILMNLSADASNQLSTPRGEDRPKEFWWCRES